MREECETISRACETRSRHHCDQSLSRDRVWLLGRTEHGSVITGRFFRLLGRLFLLGYLDRLNHTSLGDDLTRTSEVNPVFSCSTVREPALSFCVCEGRRKLRAMQRHISHGYLVNPSAGHWRARFCTCGDQRL